MKPATNSLCGMVVEVLGRVALLELAPAHDRHAIAHGHRFDLVVRHVDGRDAEESLDTRDLEAHLDSQLRVEVRERFVHEERLRAAHDRASHRHALALSPRERLRPSIQVLGETQDRRGLTDLLGDLGPGLPTDLEGEPHVLGDRHVRVERVVLEDHRHVAILRQDVVHDRAADRERPERDVLQAGQHPQRGRLAAARGADEDHELAVGDVQ